jgi:hypothetical protein
VVEVATVPEAIILTVRMKAGSMQKSTIQMLRRLKELVANAKGTAKMLGIAQGPSNASVIIATA